MDNFDFLLDKATAIHGHLCAGQVIGVRMAILGLEKINIADPLGRDRKKLYVMVEIDRCATDAIQTVTGCSLGKRSLRWFDFGVMAATFVNLETGRAVRIVAREESRELSKKYCSEIKDKYQRQMEAYKIMAIDELFAVYEVEVDIPAEDMPGRPLKRVQCSRCGDWVQDCREVEVDEQVVCRACAGQRYYRLLSACSP